MFRTLATIIVVAHLAVSLVHGAAHSGAAVPLSALQNVFVWVVILAGPLAALWLIRTGRPLGPELLALTMGGSLVFGIVNHFVIESADHVAHITADAWRLPFQLRSRVCKPSSTSTLAHSKSMRMSTSPPSASLLGPSSCISMAAR